MGGNDFKKLAYLAVEKRAQAFNGGKVNASRRFGVKRGDRAAIEACPFRDIGDAKFVAPHEKGQMAADHFIFYCRVMRSVTKIQSARNYEHVLADCCLESNFPKNHSSRVTCQMTQVVLMLDCPWIPLIGSIDFSLNFTSAGTETLQGRKKLIQEGGNGGKTQGLLGNLVIQPL